MINKKDYPLVDVFKFLFACCIVAIHTGIFTQTDELIPWMIMHLVFRLGVPYFFIASGFFLSRKILNCENKNEKKELVKKYTLKMVLPLFLWGTWGLVLEILHDFSHGKTVIFVVLNAIRHALFYPRNAMWFCLACIVAAWLLYVFDTRISRIAKVLLGTLAGGGYVCMGILANSYFFLFADTFIGRLIRLYIKIFVSTRNGLFVGFFFFLLGYFIASLTHRNKEVPIWKVWIIFIVAYIFLFVEARNLFGKVIIIDDHSQFFSFIFLIPSLFFLTLYYGYKFNCKITRWLRKLSSGIFFLHSAIISVVSAVIVKNLGISIPKLGIFCLTLIFAILTTFLVYKFDNKTTRKMRLFIGG